MKRSTCKAFFLITLPLAVILLFTGCSGKTEILWDRWGVPHIYAEDTRSMYHSFGWAQMRSHGNLILKLYAQARGRASEYFGSDYLNSDRKMLSFGIPELAETGINQMDSEYRDYIDAFAEGMNDFIESHRDSLESELLQVYPVTSADILAHTLRIICLEFLGGEDIYASTQLASAGSNAIAIAPKKTTSGSAMLMINPHLPWSDFFTWYEAHLNCPGFSAYGIALAGMPTLSMGFNRNLGWAHTVNPVDASDRYELKLKDDGYLFDGAVRQFIQKEYLIKVKRADGNYDEMPFTVKHSVHGPVIGTRDDKAWAVRVAGLGNSGIFEQYHRMSSSGNITEFETALGMLQNPMFNVIYADRDGNIMYLFNGNIPVRPEGDFSYWRGTIDGTTSRLLWEEYHSYEELPRLVNPEAGFVQNCNDPPWTCTYPAVLNKDDYPKYFAPSGMSLRPQRAVNLVGSNQKISFDELVEIKLNTGMEAADRFLDELLAASSASEDTMVKEAAEVLRQWNRKTDADSRGAVLFAAWWVSLGRDMFLKQWDPDDPVNTPSGLKDPARAAILLGEAAKTVKSNYGSLDVPWGDIYRFRLGNIDLPANGGPGDLYGIFRTMSFIKDTDNRFRTVHGDTFYAVIEFGDEPHAMVLLSYGNSSQPGNRHNGDQLEYLSEKKLRPAILSREDVRINTEFTETITATNKPTI